MHFERCRYYSERRHERCFHPRGHECAHFYEPKDGSEPTAKPTHRQAMEAYRAWKRLQATTDNTKETV
jgi:hypothetical protein